MHVHLVPVLRQAERKRDAYVLSHLFVKKGAQGNSSLLGGAGVRDGAVGASRVGLPVGGAGAFALAAFLINAMGYDTRETEASF